jgi:Uma2 family endonuclease
MATVTPTPAPVSAPTQAPAGPVKGDQRVEFIGIGWEGYEALLKVQGEKSRPQMIYIDGDVLLMSPSVIHERSKKRLGAFVLVVVEELGIPCESTGETTFRGPGEDVGVQPDESFYLVNHGPIAAKDGKEDIDLRIDPPPDLVIEVVHTHDATDAVEVLRRLRVPEVWVCDGYGLRILIRKKNGRYVESQKSQCLPFLSAAEIFDWVAKPGMTSMTQWVKEVRRWVQKVLVPRVRGQEGG